MTGFILGAAGTAALVIWIMRMARRCRRPLPASPVQAWQHRRASTSTSTTASAFAVVLVTVNVKAIDAALAAIAGVIAAAARHAYPGAPATPALADPDAARLGAAGQQHLAAGSGLPALAARATVAGSWAGEYQDLAPHHPAGQP